MQMALPIILATVAAVAPVGLVGCRQNEMPSDASVAASPDVLIAWEQIVAALRNGDRASLRERVDGSVYDRLTIGSRKQPASDAELRQLGENWAQWDVRIRSDTGAHAILNVGPEIKEHEMRFTRRQETWILTEWVAGH